MHHPNHRHAVPPRPILLRRATTSHLGRQSPGRPQGAHLSPCHRFPVTHITQITARVRLSMRRNSDSSRRSDDRYASVIAAVSQARERIRQFEHGDESDTHAHARHPRSGSFGISTTINEGNTINLDLGHAPTYLPQPRHVPGTPYPQKQQQNLYPPSPVQPEPQRLPSPSNPQPAFAPQVPSTHSAPTSAPPASTPHQTMAAYLPPFATPTQFYQQPPGPSPYVGHTPLVPIPGLVATPLATSQTLPSSWAPTTPQVLSAYVSTPATSSYNLQPVTPGSGMVAWQPLPQMHPGMSAPAYWPTPAAVTPAMPTTPLTPGQALAMPGGLPGTQSFWTPVESWPPPVRTLPLHLAPWLAPNPVNADRPHVVWDVSEPPSTAKRLSGKDIFVDMHEAFSSDATAVFPEADEIVVVCDTGFAQDMWPPIRIRKNKVTSGDVFWAIYEFFQKPVTCAEVNLIKGRSEDEYRRLLEACYLRCRRAPGLADITRRQGVKRVDCLEHRTAWRGMWPVWAPDGTWSLHLGLMASSRS